MSTKFGSKVYKKKKKDKEMCRMKKTCWNRFGITLKDIKGENI